MKRRVFWFASALLLGGPYLARADAPSENYALGEVTITARAPVGDELGGTTITRWEVSSFERNTLESAIQLAPGATVSDVGPRNESDVWLRGFDRFRVALYSDGIPVYLPADDRIDFSRFTTSDIAEIQVSKGFTSVIDGPGAMGGSINLVSREVTEPFEGDARLGTSFDDNGALNGVVANGFAGGRIGDWFAQAEVDERYQNHFRLSDSYSPGTVENGGNRDHSYSNDYNINIKAGYEPSATDQYAINFVDQVGEKDTPLQDSVLPKNASVRYWTWPAWDKQSLYFLSKAEFESTGTVLKTKLYLDRFYNSLDAYDNASFTSQTFPYAFNSYYDDYAIGGSVESDQPLLEGRDLLRAALHIRWDQHNAQEDTNAKFGVWYSQPVLTDEEMTYSAAIENTYHPAASWDLITGFSYDIRHLMQAQDFNTFTPTPSHPPYGYILHYPVNDKYAPNSEAAVIYHYSDNGSVHASVAERARFPNLFELFSSRFGTYTGNPSLQAEKTINWEVGAADETYGVQWGVSLFRNRIRDAIEAVGVIFAAPVGATTQERNVGTEVHEGAEITLWDQILPTLKLGANYTYLQRAVHTTGVIATDTPKHKLFTYANWQPIPELMITPSLEYDTKRWFQSSAFSTLYYRGGDFVRADIQAAYRIREGLVVDVGVKNLFDANYEVEDAYHAPGRSYYTDIRVTF